MRRAIEKTKKKIFEKKEEEKEEMQERIFGFFGEKNKNIVSKDINDTDTGKQSVYETVNFNVTKYKSNGVSHALVILNANSI